MSRLACFDVTHKASTAPHVPMIHLWTLTAFGTVLTDVPPIPRFSPSIRGGQIADHNRPQWDGL